MKNDLNNCCSMVLLFCMSVFISACFIGIGVLMVKAHLESVMVWALWVTLLFIAAKYITVAYRRDKW